MNSASPTSTWFGGAAGVPMPVRTKPSTTMKRTKQVHDRTIAGQQRDEREHDDHADGAERAVRAATAASPCVRRGERIAARAAARTAIIGGAPGRGEDLLGPQRVGLDVIGRDRPG